jgi:hypothetical protein
MERSYEADEDPSSSRVNGFGRRPNRLLLLPKKGASLRSAGAGVCARIELLVPSCWSFLLLVRSNRDDAIPNWSDLCCARLLI